MGVKRSNIQIKCRVRKSKSLAQMRAQANRIADNSPLNGGVATNREIRAQRAFSTYANRAIRYLDQRNLGNAFGSRYQNTPIPRSVYMGLNAT